MKDYILTIKEIKEIVKDFDTYEEAKNYGEELNVLDRDVNAHYEYEVILREDYLQNQIVNLRASHKKLYEERKELFKSIKTDLENYKLMTELLLDNYKKYV